MNYVCMWDCGEVWFERSVRGDGDIYNCMYSNTLIIWECAHMSRPSTRTNKTKQNKNKNKAHTRVRTRDIIRRISVRASMSCRREARVGGYESLEAHHDDRRISSSRRTHSAARTHWRPLRHRGRPCSRRARPTPVGAAALARARDVVARPATVPSPSRVHPSSRYVR